MKQLSSAVVLTVIVAALGVVASFFVPLPQSAKAVDFYANLALSVAIVTFYVGASIIIAKGFAAFTSKLRRPYTLIFVGLSAAGFAYLMISGLAVFDNLGAAIYSTLTAIPFIASSILTFIGTSMLAKNFSVRHLVTKWWFTVIVVVVTSLLLVVLPHAPSPTAEADFDSANVLSALAIVLFGFSAYQVVLIKRQASVAFTNALAWLCLSLFMTSVVAGGGSTLVVMVVGGASEQSILLAALVPSLFAAALFVRSAYSFNKIVEAADVHDETVARNFFGKPLSAQAETKVTSIDIVMYAANLVSQPKEIDGIMDDVRMVTSHLHQGDALGNEDNRRLLEVYTKIEDYLLTRETIRVFTKDALRQDIAQKLRLTASSDTFWPLLTKDEQQTSTPSTPVAFTTAGSAV